MNRILIVDDTGDDVKLIKAMLKSLDSDIDVAVDSEEALRKMTDNDYDIVLLDIMLPKISGIDVLKKVRKGARNPNNCYDCIWLRRASR